jgi:hypothetical protein
MTYTDRIDGDASNRVLSVDGRAVTNRIYSGSFQVAARARGERHRHHGAALPDEPRARRPRLRRARGLHAASPDFVTQSGFISRPGEVHANIAPRYTWFFERGSRIETFSYSLLFDGTWNYDRFMQRGDARDKKMHFNTSTQFRGGWTIGGSLLLETFGYDPTFYQDLYRIEAPDGGAGSTRCRSSARRGSPTATGWRASPRRASSTSRRAVRIVWGIDENFYEWASADILYAQLTLNARPSERIRIDATYQIQEYKRRTDHSLVGICAIRASSSSTRSRSPSSCASSASTSPRSGGLAARRLAHRLPAPAARPERGRTCARRRGRRNRLRGDVLLAYTPQPGTVFYLGYGARMLEPEPFRYQHLARTDVTRCSSSCRTCSGGRFGRFVFGQCAGRRAGYPLRRPTRA